MILYRLRCASGHEFDAWFASSAAYDKQAAAKLVTCAECGTSKVSKAIMAPNVQTTRSAPVPSPQPREMQSLPPAAPEESPSEIMAKMDALARKLRRHVQETHEDVGKEFASEVRKIHDGDAEERGIYGEAKKEEVRELIEDGIDVLPLPDVPEEN